MALVTDSGFLTWVGPWYCLLSLFIPCCCFSYFPILYSDCLGTFLFFSSIPNYFFSLYLEQMTSCLFLWEMRSLGVGNPLPFPPIPELACTFHSALTLVWEECILFALEIELFLVDLSVTSGHQACYTPVTSFSLDLHNLWSLEELTGFVEEDGRDTWGTVMCDFFIHGWEPPCGVLSLSLSLTLRAMVLVGGWGRVTGVWVPINFLKMYMHLSVPFSFPLHLNPYFQ